MKLTPRPLCLTYEPLSIPHAAELYSDLLDERIYTFLPTRPPKSLVSLEREYAEFAGGAPLDSGEVWLNWAVRDLETATCVGTLQATRFSDGLLWIGFTVIPSHWGRGIATTAVTWLTEELWTRFEGQAPLAAVDTRNIASIRVLERSGFSLLRQEPAELFGVATEDYIYQQTRSSASQFLAQEESERLVE